MGFEGYVWLATHVCTLWHRLHPPRTAVWIRVHDLPAPTSTWRASASTPHMQRETQAETFQVENLCTHYKV